MTGDRLLFERILGLDDSWNRSAYASVDKWITTLRRRGDRRSTKLAYLKWLSTFLRFVNLTADEDNELRSRLTSQERRESLIAKIRVGLTPDGLVQLSGKMISQKAQAFCDRYNEAGKVRTAHLALTYLRSFCKHNGLGKLELEDYNWRKNKGFEYVPNKEEVYRMADQSDARGRAIILCAFQSGLRNSALRALCYGDVKEHLQTAHVPVTIHVNLKMRQRIPQACKEDAEYYTFLGKEASQALMEYVEWRTKKLGEIEDDAPLFLPYESFSQGERKKNHLSEDSLQRMIKRAARRTKIKEWRYLRFHSLRKSFRSVLDAGYVDGGQMAEDDKEYLMGRGLPRAKEPYHNANVETLAQRYMKLDWTYLSKQAASVEQLRKKQVLDMTKVLGFSEDKIKKVEEALAKYENTDEALEEIKKLNLNSHMEDRKGHVRPGTIHNRKEIRIVRGDDKLVRFLNDGWDIVKELSADKFVMQRNSESEPA
jgi:integrase